ncbi:MAG: phosphatidylserine/phosphatidylglycerophosphate/cardiolipin synthase family protein [Endomicrobia bacterium]|nr:phosphatidylserine/phosphatidylglycerophosphate/cardiolipin synthase family protein [Endomicrobiia bacterium]
MKTKVFVLLFFSALMAVSGCHRIYNNQQTLADIDNAAFEPGEIFVYENKLYFAYEYGNENFYLSAELPGENSRKNRRNSILKAAVEEKIPQISASLKKDVTLAKNILAPALEKAVEEAAPAERNRGIVLATALKDAVLYRDAQGAVRISNPSDVPKEVFVKGRLSKIYIRRLLYKNAGAEIKAKYPDARRLVMPVDTIPLIPYIYVDLEKNTAAAIKLPDFYQIRKDVSPAVFSAGMIYSFFIKSHVFAVLKSPFTVVHRLFSTATNSLYAGLSPQIEHINGAPPPVNENAGFMDIGEFNKFLDFNITEEKYKGRVSTLIDGEAFFTDFIEKVTAATKKIYAHIYIFQTDPYSLTLADLLKKKSNEGLKVRVLTDDMNTVFNWTRDPKRLYSKDYVMPGIKKYLKTDSKVKVRTTPDTWGNVDHRKVIIIDGKIAYAGGMNFGEEYRFFWHDMMFRFEGPIALKLEDDFRKTWAFSGAGGDFASAAKGIFSKSPDYSKGVEDDMVEIRVMYTKPSSAEIFNAQIEAMMRAKSRIFIENPYFSDVRVIQELINARARGVDVRVVLPTETDGVMMSKNNVVKANIMFNNGIKVYFYPRMSHIKAAVYDNWACVGTANFDKMSLYIFSEISFGIWDEKFVNELINKLFLKDFDESKIMDKELELSPGDYIMSTLAAQG